MGGIKGFFKKTQQQPIPLMRQQNVIKISKMFIETWGKQYPASEAGEEGNSTEGLGLIFHRDHDRHFAHVASRALSYNATLKPF